MEKSRTCDRRVAEDHLPREYSKTDRDLLGAMIVVRPFEALSSAERRAVVEEAGLLREFFGTNVELSFHP